MSIQLSVVTVLRTLTAVRDRAGQGQGGGAIERKMSAAQAHQTLAGERRGHQLCERDL